MILQDAVSRDDSVRMVLSKQAWDWGVGHFFVERVPFSVRNGPYYAKRVLALFLAAIQAGRWKDASRYHVVELGAGMGLLSAFFLDALNAEAPDIYAKTTVTLTDLSEKMLTQVQTLSHVKKHGNRIRTTVLNATDPDAAWSEKAVFAYSVYLLDSLPARHVAVAADGTFQEVLVTTELDEENVLVDGRCFPPAILSASETKAAYDIGDSGFLSKLAPKLAAIIQESFSTVPLEGRMTAESVSRFKQFVASQSPASGSRFNYTEGLSDHLALVKRILVDDGLYLLSDFGLISEISDPDPEQLIAGYGLANYYTFCFPQLFAEAGAQGLSYICTDRESDQTQEVLLSASAISADLEAGFRQTFKEIGHELISDVLDELDQKTEAPQAEFEQTFAVQEARLSDDERADYYYLKTAAGSLVTGGSMVKAEKLIYAMADLYGDLAVDANLYRGFIAQMRHMHEEALAYFDRVIALCPNFDVPYASASISQLALGQYDAAIHNMKQALGYGRDADIWSKVLGVGLALRRWGKDEESKAVLSWPKSVEERYPHLLPAAFKARFDEQLAAFS